jgi:hypothetical protein
VARSAPRIDQRLLAAIADIDRRGRPIAETNRLVGQVAETMGLPKPSYEQVRQVVHRARNGGRRYGLREAYVDASFRKAAPQVVVQRLTERARVPENK